MDGTRLSALIDDRNDAFTSAVKARLLPAVPSLPESTLEWLVMEHYQFSCANVGFLRAGVRSTACLSEKGVAAELDRNAGEEDGHAEMYKQGMLEVGTEMDRRTEFAPTTEFLRRVGELCAPNPSRALGALYATETAAIFEHETLFDVCTEICRQRGVPYEGSLIKHFHDIHLSGGVEQGHKDGLAVFVDAPDDAASDPIVPADVHEGALAAIDAMEAWWADLLETMLGAEMAASTSD
jgi:hypothetical protein